MDDIRTRSRRSTGTPTPTHKVEYTTIIDDGTTGKFTRQMTAASLSELLKNPDVVLIGVNRAPPRYFIHTNERKDGEPKC